MYSIQIKVKKKTSIKSKDNATVITVAESSRKRLGKENVKTIRTKKTDTERTGRKMGEAREKNERGTGEEQERNGRGTGEEPESNGR